MIYTDVIRIWYKYCNPCKYFVSRNFIAEFAGGTGSVESRMNAISF